MLKNLTYITVLILFGFVLYRGTEYRAIQNRDPKQVTRVAQTEPQIEKTIREVATTTPSLATTTQPITKTKKVIAKPVEKIIIPQITAPVSQVIPETPQPIKKPPVDLEAINQKSLSSIVNILCMTKNSSGFDPITGSGVVIDPDGVIVTNAHIGQYFLLKDFRQKDFVECTIRTGSPAKNAYRAELLYISPEWVEKNKALLKETNPQGTGENDFALLRITGKTDGSAFVPPIPFISPNTREVIDVNEPAVLISYPASFLGGISVVTGLSTASAITAIQKIFTFTETTIDLISVGGTVVSQKGSSGGAVIDSDGTLIGIISTSSNGDMTSSRDLRAITLSHINRALQKEASFTLRDILSSDLAETALSFNQNIAPKLTRLITDELLK